MIKQEIFLKEKEREEHGGIAQIVDEVVNSPGGCTLGWESIHLLGHSNLITCPIQLFMKKKSCETPKKKKKKSRLCCLMDESGLEIFCQTPKKEKKSVLSIEKKF